LEIVKFYSTFTDEISDEISDENNYKRDKSIISKIDAWKQIFLGILLEVYLLNDNHVPDEINNNIKLLNNDHYFQQWLSESCEEAPFIYLNEKYTAPTTLYDLYINYEEWSACMDYKHVSKLCFKNELLKWQANSPYGLSLGKSSSSAGCNGTRVSPMFNLTV
jgi:hypothetical protein